MQGITILGILLLVNTIFSILYFVYMTINKKKKKGLVISLFFFFCPIVGFCIMGLAKLFYYILIIWRKEGINFRELSFNKERIKIISQPNVTKETNMVPLEEALVVTGKLEKRNVFLDVLKIESEESLSAIRSAVEHEDSEISHYAASFISDTISKFKEKENQLELSCIENAGIEQIQNYIEYVIAFLRHGVLTETEQKYFALKVDKKLYYLMENSDNSKLSSKNISEMVLIWKDLKEYDRAGKLVNIGLDKLDNNLESFKSGLKYYHSTCQYNKFFNLLNELKESTLIFDDEILDMVRFFG